MNPAGSTNPLLMQQNYLAAYQMQQQAFNAQQQQLLNMQMQQPPQQQPQSIPGIQNPSMINPQTHSGINTQSLPLQAQQGVQNVQMSQETLMRQNEDSGSQKKEKRKSEIHIEHEMENETNLLVMNFMQEYDVKIN